MNNEIGIYIHIPFCLRKCFYCDFSSYAQKEELIESYVYALCNEILENVEILSQYKITTIYIGGGTPSYIPEKYIVQILNTLKLFVNIEEIKEITIECNPNSMTLEKLKAYKDAGVNRISIGLQSTHNDVLKKIGRLHTLEDFEIALGYANEAGIENISVDLMYPLPDLSLEAFKESVDYVVSLKNKNVKHISIYNLEVHEGTKLDFILKEGYVSLVDEDTEYDMYTYLKDTLERNGYKRYEISNYALDGYEAVHNLKYWNQEQYLGFGSAASSFFNQRRYTNIKDIKQYIDAVNFKRSHIIENEQLDLLALMKEYVILSLRKAEGISKTKFEHKFKKDINDIFAVEIKELISLGLLTEEKDNILLTQRGKEIANIVWEKFV